MPLIKDVRSVKCTQCITCFFFTLMSDAYTFYIANSCGSLVTVKLKTQYFIPYSDIPSQMKLLPQNIAFVSIGTNPNSVPLESLVLLTE